MVSFRKKLIIEACHMDNTDFTNEAAGQSGTD